MKETFSLFSNTADSIWKCADNSGTCQDTVSSVAKVTNEFVSGCVAMTAFGIKLGDNIRTKYVNDKKLKEEARLKALKEAEEAQRAEEERRRIEAERIELERKTIEKIKMEAEEERRRVRKQQMEAE
eukprot:4336425-Ditylum_brightwellii.AAC.1